MASSHRAATYGRTLGCEYLNAVTDTVVETLTAPPRTQAALVSVIGSQPIRWRSDGISPTTTIGHPLAPGGHLELFKDDIANAEFLCAGGTTDLFVSYFGDY